MPTLVELTAQIVASNASGSSMTPEELVKSLQQVHATLKALETGDTIPVESLPSVEPPRMTIKQAFKKDEVICFICNKGFKTLKRHLAVAHDMKPGQYRKEYGIPSTQSLAAKSYVESRRQMAIDKGLGDGLAKARATKKAEIELGKAALPVVTVNAPVPVVKKKPVVPDKVEILTDPAKVKKTSSVKSAPKSKK